MPITSPTEVTGLGLWLDGSTGLYQERTGAGATTPADSDTEPVGSWLDQSGNSRHFTAASDGVRPTLAASAVNSRNAVRLNGSTQYLELLSGLGMTNNVAGITAFCVRKADSVAVAQKTIFAISTGGATTTRFGLQTAGNAAEPAGLNTYSVIARRLDADSATNAATRLITADTNWHITCGRVKYALGGGMGLMSFVDGSVGGRNTLASTGNTSSTDSNNIRLGCNVAGAQFFDGDVAELLVWPRVLSDDEYREVEEWLATRYAITLYRHTVDFADSAALIALREDLIDDIWSGNGFPSAGSDSISTSVTDPLATYSLSPTNLLRVDSHDIAMYDNTPTLLYTSTAHVWYPTAITANGKLAFFHCGHTSSSAAWNAGNQGATVKRLVEEGYTVVGLRMTPNGLSSGDSVAAHNAFPVPDTTLNYMRLFAEPTVRMINELVADFDAVVYCGLSGGGWTVAMVQAIDTRIRAAVSVAGSVPLGFTESTRDWEQLLPRSTRVAAYDYQELYVMGATGGRAQLQIHNTADACCFNEATYSTFAPHKADIEALATTFGGTWELRWETNSNHDISANSRDDIVAWFGSYSGGGGSAANLLLMGVG